MAADGLGVLDRLMGDGNKSVVAATAPTGPPDSTTTSVPAVSAFFDGLSPTWSATNVDDAGWDIEVLFLEGDHHLGDIVASVKYPGHGCMGDWTLEQLEGPEVTLQESIHLNPDMVCAPAPTIRLTKETTDRLRYRASGFNVDAATTILSPS